MEVAAAGWGGVANTEATLWLEESYPGNQPTQHAGRMRKQKKNSSF